MAFANTYICKQEFLVINFKKYCSWLTNEHLHAMLQI
jgi:hypothetical protein